MTFKRFCMSGLRHRASTPLRRPTLQTSGSPSLTERPLMPKSSTWSKRRSLAAVAIPSGSIVLGQFGPVLVLQSAQPSSLLELWNPSTQTIVASLGPFDQLAVSPTSVAWTLTNSLDVATADGVVRRLPSGPVGDWATALAFSPTGSKLATVWAPSPASERADSTESAWHYRSLSLLDIGSGTFFHSSQKSGHYRTGHVELRWHTDLLRPEFSRRHVDWNIHLSRRRAPCDEGRYSRPGLAQLLRTSLWIGICLGSLGPQERLRALRLKRR